MKNYTDFWKRYIDFTGRSTRAQYWLFRLIDLIVMLVLAIPVFWVMSEPGTDLGAVEKMTTPQVLSLAGSTVVLLLYLLATVVPRIALSIRRLRDARLPLWLIALWPLSAVFIELWDIQIAFWYVGIALLVVGYILMMFPSKGAFDAQ